MHCVHQLTKWLINLNCQTISSNELFYATWLNGWLDAQEPPGLINPWHGNNKTASRRPICQSIHSTIHPPTSQPADSSAMYSMLLSEAPAAATRHSSHLQATAAPPMHHSLAPLSQSVQNIPAFNEPPKLVQQHSTEKRKFHWFAYIIIWMHFLQPNFCDWTMNKFKFIIAVQSTPETTLDHFNSFSLS